MAFELALKMMKVWYTPPYVIGIIELVEQPGLRISAIINADPAAVRIGQQVTMRVVDVGDSGFRVPEFVLEESKPL